MLGCLSQTFPCRLRFIRIQDQPFVEIFRPLCIPGVIFQAQAVAVGSRHAYNAYAGACMGPASWWNLADQDFSGFEARSSATGSWCASVVLDS